MKYGSNYKIKKTGLAIVIYLKYLLFKEIKRPLLYKEEVSVKQGLMQ